MVAAYKKNSITVLDDLFVARRIADAGATKQQANAVIDGQSAVASIELFARIHRHLLSAGPSRGEFA